MTFFAFFVLFFPPQSMCIVDFCFFHLFFPSVLLLALVSKEGLEFGTKDRDALGGWKVTHKIAAFWDVDD